MTGPRDLPTAALRDPERLASLHRTALLDTLPEDAFDRLIRLAARAMRVPLALMTLVDENRQFFKSFTGLHEPWATLRQTPLTHSFCQYVVGLGEPLVVPDAREDPALRDNRAIAEMGVVAYLGVPLRGDGGLVVGSLAVCDHHPREWSAADVEMLHDLAAAVTTEMDWRRDVGELRRADAQLRRAERLASLGTLLSGVAHELNNPLAAVRSFAQLLLLDERPPDDREALEIIEREAVRAAKIVADLRRVARQTQAEGDARAPVQLNEVVRHVLQLRGYTLATHNVEVRQDLAPGLPPVHADRGEMEQVVLHLVLNAEHSLADRPGERRLLLRTRPGRLGVALEVVDTGPGIPPEHLERIFDPFWTTREPGKGAGLGLSMVYGIVAGHGGEIRVESEPGRGAAFTVELPALPAPADAGAGDEAGLPAGPGLRVLVVDDEAPIRHSLARYLARRGHAVDQAADGREALRRLDAAAEPYDVVLADLRMPGLSGDRLLAEMRVRHPGSEHRLVFITGDALGEEMAGAIASSGVPVVFKPFELEQVARAVERRARQASGRPE